MQRWHVETSRNGRITASTSRFYGTDLPRLFGLFNDPESWPMESPERLIRIVPEELLSYSFDNDTRVEITFERIRTGLFRVNLVHEQLHDTEELEACQGYWEEILQDIFNRLLCEPVHAATAFGKINLFFKVGVHLQAEGVTIMPDGALVIQGGPGGIQACRGLRTSTRGGPPNGRVP